MSIPDLPPSRPSLSLEVFPPRTEEAGARLSAALDELAVLAPRFVSVTYGASGSTRDFTTRLVDRLRLRVACPLVPHLTCVGHTRAEVDSLLTRYSAMGVQTIMALRGDPPRNGQGAAGDFRHAAELVRVIRAAGPFRVGAAAFPEGHPDTPNRLREMDHLKAKVDAGVDYLCTQMFFDNAVFFDFVERCRLAGIRVPIVAGIMPVTSLAGLDRMAELAGGTRFPARLLRTLLRWEGDAASQRAAGLAYSAGQCRELLAGGVEGLHFYTMNQATPTLAVARGAGCLPGAEIEAGA